MKNGGLFSFVCNQNYCSGSFSFSFGGIYLSRFSAYSGQNGNSAAVIGDNSGTFFLSSHKIVFQMFLCGSNNVLPRTAAGTVIDCVI